MQLPPLRANIALPEKHTRRQRRAQSALLVSIKKIKIQVDLRRASTAWQERNMYPQVQCAQAASVECIKSKIRLCLLRASTANLDLRLLRNPLSASDVI